MASSRRSISRNIFSCAGQSIKALKRRNEELLEGHGADCGRRTRQGFYH